KPGDSVRVLMTGWDDDGNAVLSYQKARAAAAAKMIEEAHARKVPVRGTIKRVVKGGVLVDVGMDCFMPASQVDLFRAGELESLAGHEVEAGLSDHGAGRGGAVFAGRQ